MSKYRIVESVGSRVEAVHSYEDLEIHHPSQRGREPGRVYATVDGHREEVLGRRGTTVRDQDGHVYVSKDFVLQDSQSNSSRVPVPAPVAGVVGRIDRANGLVSIYDRPGGEMIAQIRHMDLRQSTLQAGDPVQYGQPLGLQGGFGGGNPHRYGTHVHIDFNEQHLDQFRKYINDMDTGVLRPGQAVAARQSAPQSSGRSEGLLRQGDDGSQVRELQRALSNLGYRDAAGRDLVADGDFGARTGQALREFQRDHGLKDDGVAGPATQRALEAAVRERSAAPAATAPTMADPQHPGHALYRQALEKIAPLGLGDERSQRNAAATLAFEARVSGMDRIDHVVKSADGAGLFAVQGRLDDPGHRRIHAASEQAVSQSLEQSAALWKQDVAPAEAVATRAPQQEPARMSL